jgi:hypothetical protein
MVPCTASRAIFALSVRSIGTFQIPVAIPLRETVKVCALMAISGLIIGTRANRLRLVGPDKFIRAALFCMSERISGMSSFDVGANSVAERYATQMAKISSRHSAVPTPEQATGAAQQQEAAEASDRCALQEGLRS